MDEAVARGVGAGAVDGDSDGVVDVADGAVRPRLGGSIDDGIRVPTAATGEEERDDDGASHGSGVYAQTGDVDKDGEIIDELRARLARAIGVTVGEVDADAHLDAVLGELARAQVRAVNVLAQNAAGLRP